MQIAEQRRYTVCIKSCENISGAIIAAYFGPRRNEKILPSLFFPLMPNSARSFSVIGMNGSEPTTGNDGIAGGNLTLL